MKKLFFLTLSLMAGFLASCGGGSGGAYSALFGDGPKALKPAQAQCTITVSDYNGNGSIDNADIQAALNTASTNNQNDVVCIPAGTYSITSTLTYNLSSVSSECGKKLTIRADGGSVILDGGYSVQILSINTSNCSDDADGDITIEGITFQNGYGGYGGGLFVSVVNANITLTNNTFSDNSAYYVSGGAFVSSGSGSITFTNNTFSGNSADYEGGGAYVGSYSGSITFTNNTFSSNSAYYQGGGAYVRLYYDAATLHFYNNILWNNTANSGGNDGDDLYVDNDADSNNTPSPVNLVHNLFSTTATPIDFSTAPQTEKVYIRLAGNYNQNIASGCTNTGQYDNIQADPKFVNPQNGDLRLQASSPAINAGCNNAPSIPNTDKDGNQRIVGTAVDMGAYEYQGQQQPQQYTLTVNKSGNGSGSISATGCTLSCTGNTCTCTANAGTQITLSASADQNSIFAGWSNGTGSASCTGTGQCTITLNQDSSITATFNLKQYTITASASPPEGGSITCTPNPVNHGQTATCTITANANYTLQSVDGTCGGTLSGNTYTTNAITSDCTVVANFSISISQYTLTVNKSGTGSGTVTSSPQGINCSSTCSANFDANTTVTLTATVSSGSTFAGWSGDCSSCGNNTTCQVSMTSAKTCTATFNPQQSGGGAGGGGCSMGGTADASMLWWLVPPVLALARRLRRSA